MKKMWLVMIAVGLSMTASGQAMLEPRLQTSNGGTAIGETTYRISSIVLDDSKRGWSRVWREVVAGLVNPVRLVNRLMTGKAWLVRPTKHKYHDHDAIPLGFEASAGMRYLAEKGSFEHGAYNPYVNLPFHLF